MSGGRTRQPRLGVVDAFDLDRQRQLVLVRRDNVEHLLMIGGPNDVVIEAAIVRAPATLNARDKENGVSTPSVGIPAPVAQSSPPPMVSSVGPLPSIDYEPNVSSVTALAPRGPELVPTPQSVAPTPEPASPPIPQQAPPASSPDVRLPPAANMPTPARPLPGSQGPRPASAAPIRPQFSASSRTGATTSLPPRPPFSRATPLPASAATAPGRVEPAMDRASSGGSGEPATNRPGAEQREEAAVSQDIKTQPPGTDAGPASVATPPQMVVVPPPAPAPIAAGSPGVATAPPSRAATSSGSRPNNPPLRPQPPRPAGAPAATPAQSRAPLPTLGSLEEEMAKLLGRPMPPTDQSGG
ncbi:flagellar biosynthetic protein FliO [Hyphomicrobiales bacterium BP6-180914]|uniref:Flagellar biosynthetic protein FliO n=1 Tax=Lichenifustis flavocetrariae TaxID=2949735 RepID=A0AA41YQV4_9HYPH|nr:flagellar biosynthetic protein FliO [Lichenifustis flavocetrariae]MCW6506474.1 flagellar biosynthetic protein FliO [Lichenifustis flavocetrariae]